MDFWHLASLDAPTVAVVWAFAIARSAHVRLEPWMAILLASGTWTVYVLDRILDARGAITANISGLLRERHHFHWRHRRILIPLAFCTGVSALVMIFRCMPAAARRHDSIVAAAALAYFSGVHAKTSFPSWLQRLCSKELLVGILFAAGCAAPTLTRICSAFALPIALSFLFFAALAWVNCAAISNWELERSSIRISAVAVIIALLGLSFAICLSALLPRTSALLSSGAVSAFLILVLHRTRHRINPLTLRALADLVLLAPAVLFIPGVLPG